ncbi:hypothetical protein FE257_004903 [Aspergillus nanangensis]|uniref:Mannosyl phosphorylinositol ceramide synthase SUR1 n=1 Tax=Aspergillus nanangensis TaxID=2582783 RepID=A0AAD4CAJ1_ASPNN|nr:hypothetical protein FE257_004903 [Aspergillus nanangensis]
MRRKTAVFAVIILGSVLLLSRSVFTLITLLFEDALADSIPAGDLSLKAPSSNIRSPVIPKIIHQTFKSDSIPENWKEAQQSCRNLHPDYEYILWTDEMARNFIATHYPWFLDSFDGYLYPIQRADSIRYFVLAHMGGIYIDLDNGCNRRLDPLLGYSAWVPVTEPTGISNDAMGSVPRHPFFIQVIQSLRSYDRSWLLPYVTVMYSTGPLFLSVLWKEYMRTQPDEADRVRVLMSDEFMNRQWSFFKPYPGSSWHKNDARVIFWMGDHWKLLVFCVVAFLGLAGMCLWMVYSKFILLAVRYRHEDTCISGIPLLSPLSPPNSCSPGKATLRGRERYFKFAPTDEEEQGGFRSFSKPPGLDD